MMKTFLNFIIVFTLISSLSCQKDTSPLHTIPSEFSSGDDSGISDSIRSLYQSDATNLTFRHIFNNNMSDTDSVFLPQYLIDSFYDGLIHIYNCKNIISTDTITKIHPVHTFPYVSFYRLVIGLDTSYSWTKKWISGFTTTGNDTIDSLMAKYELELSGIIVHRFAVLYTKMCLNMLALGNKFTQISGVTSAEPDGAGGSGDDIEAYLESENKRYIYSIGWGDCCY